MSNVIPSPNALGSLLDRAQIIPPANLRAEQALLGAMLANNRCYEKFGEFLRGEHFADPIHGVIYKAMEERIERGQVADMVTLHHAFSQTGELEDVGGTKYLADLLAAMVGILNAGDYARVIYDAWVRRQLVDIGHDMLSGALVSNPDADGEAQVEQAQDRLYALAEHADQSGPVAFKDAISGMLGEVDATLKAGKAMTGLTTGFADLDALTGGLHGSDLLILAGRPGMGKTALATGIAISAAKTLRADFINPANEFVTPRPQQRHVAIFSLEMSAQQLAQRVVGEHARISSDRIRRADLSIHKDFPNLVAIARDLQQLPVFIDDTPAISLTMLRNRCRRLKRTHNLALVVVDYLQLMRPPQSVFAENRVQEVSMITQGLKAIAKELQVPVIALSQLSRAVESREDKRPQLSDLRESGSIEQDADGVFFVYRHEYYLAMKAPNPAHFGDMAAYEKRLDEWQREMEAAHNKAELLVAKNRHGPVRTIEMFFEAEYTRFADLDQIHTPL